MGEHQLDTWLRTWANSRFMMEIGLTTQEISLVSEDPFDSYRCHEVRMG